LPAENGRRGDSNDKEMSGLTCILSFGIDRGEGAKGMEFKTREIDDIVIYDIKWEFKIREDIPVALHKHVKNKLEMGKRYFLFNLKDVTYLESLGLGEIVGCLISISNSGGKLILINVLPKIRLMLEITGLMNVFEIADDEETAIKNFS
jgi:anti-sigma B factor antagonist